MTNEWLTERIGRSYRTWIVLWGSSLASGFCSGKGYKGAFVEDVEEEAYGATCLLRWMIHSLNYALARLQ